MKKKLTFKNYQDLRFSVEGSKITTLSSSSSDTSTKQITIIAVSISVVVVVALVAVIVFVILVQRRYKRTTENIGKKEGIPLEERTSSVYFGNFVIKYEELQFKEVLGSGAFGKVTRYGLEVKVI